VHQNKNDKTNDSTLSTESFRENHLKCRIICKLVNGPSAVEMLHDSAPYKLLTIDTDLGNRNVI